MSSRSIGPVRTASSRTGKQRVVLSLLLSLCVIATLFSTAPPASAAGFIKNPSSLNFGQVGVGTSSPTQVITLTNDNAVNMNITSVNLSGASAHYSMLQDCTPAVAPDNSCEIAITFNPLAVGTKQAEVVVTHDQSPNPDVIGFTGDGVAGLFEAEPANLNFGTLELSDTLTKKFSVDNKGPGSITVTHIDIFGDNANFNLTTGDCGGGVIPPFPFTLGNGQGCTFEVEYNPATLGAHAGSLRLVTTDPNSPFNVPLTGLTIADPVANLVASPDPVLFGGKGIGSVSNKVVEITNNGTAAANISSITMQGGDGLFTVANTCGSLNPGASCNATITFSPTTVAGAGNKTSQLRIVSDAPGSPQLVDVSGDALAGNLVASPTSHDFGQLSTADPALSELIEVTNTGPGTVDFAAITITGDDAAFAHPAGTCTPATVLANGASCTLGATFNPLVNGATTATGRITSDAANSPLEIVYKGEGIAPNMPGISVSPSPLAYGTKGVGSVSNEILTVTNTGNAPLNIAGVAMVGGDLAMFPLGAHNCGAGIAPGGHCTITSTFAPTVLGDLASQIQIVSNAPGGNTLVDVSGTGAGPILDIAPATVDYGSQVVGTSSPATLITATNNGNAPLTFVGAPTMGGANPLQYTLSGNTCGASLAAGQSCSVMVQFTPNSVPLGNKAAQVEFASNAPGSPHISKLSGLSVIGKAADLSATELDFGTVNVGETSAPQTLSLTNTGIDNVTLPLASILFGGDVADFTFLTNGCTPLLVLPPGASCETVIEFTPSAEGNRSTTYVGSSDAPGSPHLAMLKGFGAPAAAPVLELSPTSINYGSLPLGVEGPAQVITAKNTGTADLIFSAAPSLAGMNPLQFDIDGDTCGTGTLAPGASCTILARFTPNATIGNKDATLVFASNAAGSPHAVHLAGLAAPALTPIATLSPTPADFGNVGLGVPSLAQVITLTNTGTAELNMSSDAFLDGVDAAEFQLSANSCLSGAALPPGASCTVTVYVDPTSTGLKSASLVFENDAPGSPQQVPLFANVVNGAAVNLTPTSIDFGDQGINTTSGPKVITLTNVGTQDLLLGSDAQLVGPDAGEYVEGVNTCLGGSTIVPLGTCSFTVQFSPTSAGPKTAAVQFENNAPGSPQTVPLTGNGAAGLLTLLPSNLVTFGNQGVGTVSGTRTVTLKNLGAAPVTLGAVAPTLTGFDAGEFEMGVNTCTANLVLDPTEGCSMQFRFVPTSIGAKSAAVLLDHDALDAPALLLLSGTGIEGVIADLAPTSLNFGNQGTGTQSAGKTVKITNFGPAPLNFNSPPTIAGLDAGHYKIVTDACPASLNPGGSCEVTVAFAPNVVGPLTAALQFDSDMLGTLKIVPLLGIGVIGPEMNFNVKRIDFNSHGLATPARTIGRTIRMRNTGLWPMTIPKAPRLVGKNTGSFRLHSNTCFAGMVLMPTKKCSITVEFGPPLKGKKTAGVKFFSDASGAPAVVLLRGHGERPHMVMNDYLHFSPRHVGERSFGKTVTIKNHGPSTLVIKQKPTIIGIDKEDFLMTGRNCFKGTKVFPNGTCSFTIIFAPEEPGRLTASVLVRTNGPRTKRYVTLKGRGLGDPLD